MEMIDRRTRALELARWLEDPDRGNSRGMSTDVRACTIRIGADYFDAAEYRQTDRGEGSRYYVLGAIPASYRRGNVVWQFHGSEDHVSPDYYVAGYYGQTGRGVVDQSEANRRVPTSTLEHANEYHPFGPMFLLFPWDAPGSVDQYEPAPYARAAVAAYYFDATDRGGDAFTPSGMRGFDVRHYYASRAYVAPGPFSVGFGGWDGVLCADGRRRRAFISYDGVADTFFSVPAYVHANGARVYGYVTSETLGGFTVRMPDDPETLKFHAYTYRANCDRIPIVCAVCGERLNPGGPRAGHIENPRIPHTAEGF